MKIQRSSPKTLHFASQAILGLTLMCATGCSETASTPQGNTITDLPPDMDGHAAHDHPSEGPHHGDLVELGNEEFHAEVVHGEGGSVTVYILDSAAKVSVPIDAAELSINIAHDGEAEQFKLPAAREASDPEGKSSRFSLSDAELTEDLDDHDAVAKLVVVIDDKSFSGRIEHKHEGEHSHEDHKH